MWVRDESIKRKETAKRTGIETGNEKIIWRNSKWATRDLSSCEETTLEV